MDATPSRDRRHRMQRVMGRDTGEVGRAATTLELLFDLVFVVAVGQAADQLARLLAQGHALPALGGYAFTMLAALWAWVNFSWFSSAFDTDDWLHRIATMVQMVGATIFGFGIPVVFHSMDVGAGIDNGVMVAGYVVMRIALVFQWLRAARQSPQYRKTCLIYAGSIVAAQIGWVAMAIVPLAIGGVVSIGTVLMAIELGGPYIAETRGIGTPWHAHHIAERYGGLAIIALGEGVVGTVASLSAVVHDHGWTTDALLVVVAGMGLTFGMWWVYFLFSAGDVLHGRRELALKWSLGSIPVVIAIAATGAGLHVAALVIGRQASISPVAAVSSLAVPVAAYMVGLYWLHAILHDEARWFPTPILAATVLILTAAPALAAMGVSMTMCLMVVMAAPAVSVVGYELCGSQRPASAIAPEDES